LYLDKSKINTYLSCGYRYYLEYVKQVEKEKLPELILGNDFHFITSKFYDYVNDTSKEHFYKVIEQIVKDNNISMNEELKKLLNNFVQFEHERIMKCIKKGKPELFKPVVNEQYFKDDELLLEGTVDRVFKDFDNKLILMEIKTGQLPMYKTTVEALTREMAIYHLILKKNNILCEKFYIYYPRKNRIFEVQIYDRILAKTIRTIKKVRANIEAGIFNKNKGLKCKNCPVLKYCVNTDAHT